MKPKHLNIRLQQLLALEHASNCPRRKFAAMLIDESTNVVLMDAYNGGPRGGGKLCGGDVCLRDTMNISSGQQVEIGCIHAEMNLVCNCAAEGVSMKGKTVLVTGEPCLMCAKLLHHAGVKRLVAVNGGYVGGHDGVDYLSEHGVTVDYIDGPKDPRS